jgi:hypothetical protein
MAKKKEKRGRKPLPQGQKKLPQPTIKINEVLYPFVKLLKVEYKAKRVDAEKLNALTRLLLDDNADLSVKKELASKPENTNGENSGKKAKKDKPKLEG